MTLRPLLLLATGSLLLAGGCRTVTGGSCHQQQPYQTAANLPPLSMPTGLEGPDTTEALEIPEVTEPEQPLDKDGPCLDAPPAITAPPLPATPEYDNLDRQGRLRPRTETPDAESEPEEDEPQRRRRRPPSRPR
jgi:uncharacterized lipoprotein